MLARLPDTEAAGDMIYSWIHSGKGVSLQVPHWRELTADIDNFATAVSDEDTDYVCKLSQKHQATVKMFKGKIQVRHWLGGP